MIQQEDQGQGAVRRICPTVELGRSCLRDKTSEIILNLLIKLVILCKPAFEWLQMIKPKLENALNVTVHLVSP